MADGMGGAAPPPIIEVRLYPGGYWVISVDGQQGGWAQDLDYTLSRIATILRQRDRERSGQIGVGDVVATPPKDRMAELERIVELVQKVGDLRYAAMAKRCSAIEAHVAELESHSGVPPVNSILAVRG